MRCGTGGAATQNRELVDEVAPLVEGGLVMQLVGQAAVDYSVKHGVTMVMVTEIKPGKEAAYRAWADRIQKLQAKFPGYVGSFVQPPQADETGWTTVLRFDSTANLERWLKSDARAAMVKESEDLVQGFHAQRVDTSFPGWVPNDPATGKPPNRWKTACLILLTLFPVVMLELQVPQSALAELNPAVAHLHRQCDQRCADHVAADAAGDLWFHAWLFPENKPRWLVLTMPIVPGALLRRSRSPFFWRLLYSSSISS